ncbi:MAG TPA: CapA family protein [Clostridia bacterium]|nr:CapA family protein [Clostridia bacterium]
MKKLSATVAVILITAAAVFYYNYSKPVHILAVGDILLDRGVGAYLEKNGFDYPYTGCGDSILKADIAFANLECPLTEGGKPALKRPELIFRGNTRNGPALKDAGFDILNLANNHTMDQGREGLLDTVELLESSGIRTLGAGKSRSEARKPVFIEKGWTKLGFLGYSDFPPEGYMYDEDKADVARPDMKTLKEEIRTAAEQCDFLVVSFHWGKEFDSYPGDRQREMAHAAIDSGAGLVIGHHPHMLQGAEEYKGKLIFYSLGNFVFDRQLHKGTDESVMLDIAVTDGECREARIIPVRIEACRPVIVQGEEAEAILDRYADLSEGYGVDIDIAEGIGYIRIK